MLDVDELNLIHNYGHIGSFEINATVACHGLGLGDSRAQIMAAFNRRDRNTVLAGRPVRRIRGLNFGSRGINVSGRRSSRNDFLMVARMAERLN